MFFYFKSAAEDQRAGKRKKRNRDPNAPKRPRNAFLMYCKSQRDQAKEENQNKGFQDVTRILSQKWKDLPNEEKQKYFDMYNEEKQRYKIEMSSYVSASLQTPEHKQEDKNITSHHDYDKESYRNDISGMVGSLLITADTSRVATTTISESPYINDHPYEQYINENEARIGFGFEERDLVEAKGEDKVDIGEDDYESDELVDELRSEREEVMENEDEVRMVENENERKKNEGETADSEEENMMNEAGSGSTSENE